MRKVEIIALRRDIDRILEGLGRAGCFQLALDGPEKSEDTDTVAEARKTAAIRTSPHGAALERVQAIRRSLGLDFPDQVPVGARMPTPSEEKALEALWAKVAGFDAEWNANKARIERTREALDEAKAFAGLKLPWRSLDHLSFLAVRVGYLNTGNVSELLTRLGDRAMIFPVDDKNLIVAATTKSGRFALDTELGKAGFAAKAFPADFSGIPLEVPATLERELDVLEKRTVELEGRRQALKSELYDEWMVLAASFAVADAVENLKADLTGSEQALRLIGWMPKNRIKAVSSTLRSIAGDRVALRTYLPREVKSVRKGEEEVPVLLRRWPFISSFERMVTSFGVPMYGTIDPTPFVALFFTCLFSIMFGDVGQGFLILLGGIVLRFELIPAFRKIKIFSPIVIAAGLGAMFMGILTGSLFSNEEWLVPLERVLTGFFLGHEQDRFLPLLSFLLEGHMDKVIAFFGFTIAIGVVINSLGLIFNMIDRVKTGRYGEAIFHKNGLCGAIFLWWAIGMGIRVILGGKLGWWDGIGLGLPVVLLIFEEQLAGLVDGHRHHNDDGTFANVIKALVTVIEVFSYYLSNTLSFLRVGAFALSHVVLSYIIFLMGDMVRESSGFGIVWEILIVLIGNAIILVLEGMVVAIQVVRLQYYEFLSKFLTETGTLFAPFRFNFRKE